MNLHENKDAFRLILKKLAKNFGGSSDVIEKDYYVTLILYELSQKQQKKVLK